MAQKEDVIFALEQFHKIKPYKAFHNINQTEEGLFAVLKILNDKQTPQSSKDISKILGISSARVTILLKKMEQKGLIIKTQSEKDARAICVSLSEKGQKYAMELKTRIFHSMERIIDEIGIEEIKKLFATLGQIHTILYETRPKYMEDDYV